MTITLDRPAVRNLTPDHARALLLLVDGKRAQDVSRETGVQLGRIAQIVRVHGGYIHPSTGLATSTDNPGEPLTIHADVRALAEKVIQDAPAPAVPAQSPADIPPGSYATPSSVAQILTKAAAYEDNAKIQQAMERLYNSADRLRMLVQEAEDDEQKATEREQAIARVNELERQLAAAREEARQLKAPTGSSRSGSGSGRRNSRTAQIRKWAKENGYDIGDRGVIPSDVVRAYDNAHPTA